MPDQVGCHRTAHLVKQQKPPVERRAQAVIANLEHMGRIVNDPGPLHLFHMARRNLVKMRFETGPNIADY